MAEVGCQSKTTTITVWWFLPLFPHAFGSVSFASLSPEAGTLLETQNFDSLLGMPWFHLATDQILCKITYFRFCLKVSSDFKIGILLLYLMESPEFCGSRNSYTSRIPGTGKSVTVGKSIKNKDPTKVTFISSCCFDFGSASGLFWTCFSRYLKDRKPRAYPLNCYLLLGVTFYCIHSTLHHWDDQMVSRLFRVICM